MVRAEAVELRIECVEVGKIAHPDRAAADLVLIGRTDAAAGGADLARTRGGFAHGIELAVERQDQRAVVGHREVILGDAHALPLELGDFGLQRPRIEYHAVADDRQRAAHDPRRQQAELVGLRAHYERVPRVVTALEAHDGIGAARQPVDDLALALIAPLGADHGDVGQARRPLC